MKKKVVILGSTGSIGSTTFDIIKKDKKSFDVIMLSANKNIARILYQANELNVKNLVITDYVSFLKIKKRVNLNKIKIFNNHLDFYRNLKKKIDYTMSAISGLDGLEPTLVSIKYTKKIAVANKESIICAWNLIYKNLKLYKTEFIPVDSEHFSIWSLINKIDKTNIKKIIITASGGPFLNLPYKDFKKVSPKRALNHPSWSMGRKISIDSATMMNKVFEVIEAQRIFNLDKNKFQILIHPKSYIHTIVLFKNGLTKILIHDTNMKIPIFNSLYDGSNKEIKSKKLNLEIMNNLELTHIDIKKFPSIGLLKNIPNKISLFETVLISANDLLVNQFLKKKIKFTEISKYLKKITNLKEFKKFKAIKPKNFKQILTLSSYVRLKTLKTRIR